jgi:hypothetical protein
LHVGLKTPLNLLKLFRYVNLIEQPLFCQLERECAKNVDEQAFLQFEYAKRYIRVMMAQSPHMNNFFDEDTMTLCTKIVHPYAEVNQTANPQIKDPLTIKPFRILNSNLCECENCSYSTKTVIPNVLMILFLIINLFN